MEWKLFFRDWTQRLLDMLISIKVLLLITMVLFCIFSVNITGVIAGIITSVLGIREGYKVVRTFKGTGNNDRV
jgi:uncharacterized membrane protein